MATHLGALTNSTEGAGSSYGLVGNCSSRDVEEPSFEQKFENLYSDQTNLKGRLHYHTLILEGRYSQAYSCLERLTSAFVKDLNLVQDEKREIDFYDDTTPFQHNMAMFNDGERRISGSLMSGNAIVMGGVTQSGVDTFREYLIEQEIPLVVRLTPYYGDCSLA